MSAPKTPAVTTQVQKVELPAWVDAASQQNYADADKLGDQKYQPYTGERVAQLSELEQQAPQTLQAGMDLTNKNLGTATGIAEGLKDFSARDVNMPGAVNDVSAQSFLSRDINAYMDPNLQSVINPTLENMDRGIKTGLTSIGDNTRGVGAFGGSRHGVAEAVYGAEGERNKAMTEAGLRSAAFTDAAGRITTDNASALQAALANQGKDVTGNAQRLQAEVANQGADISGANVRLGAGSLANTVGQTASDTAGRNSILQQQFGANGRAIEQAGLDTDYASFLEQRDAPKEALNLKLAALGMSPYGKTTSGTTTSEGGSSSNPMMTGIGAAATILPLLFSDRKTKKNIKRVGKVPGTDLNKYEFEYKKGFMGRDTPKQVGLMADDVKKKVPSAVVPMNVKGKKVDAVNYEMAIGHAPRDKRDDKGKLRGTYKPRGVGIGGKSRAA